MIGICGQDASAYPTLPLTPAEAGASGEPVRRFPWSRFRGDDGSSWADPL